MKTKELLAAVKAANVRKSAWNNGVKAYAVELVEGLEVDEVEASSLQAVLLNGAKDWKEYSGGGCSLIYNADIAARLCRPSELRKLTCNDGGLRRPNAAEEWLDTQARALTQAYLLIRNILLAR